MRILAVDPGPEVSGVVTYCTDTGTVSNPQPAADNLVLTEALLELRDAHECMAIEMIASYGMPVGKDVFETCLWIGRFREIFGWDRTTLVYRKDVKLELCGSPRARDSNIRQALLDRFPATGGGAKPAIGTKASPGPLYGVSKHAWSALAVGVTFAAQLGG
jgi:hypothetical protein